MYSSLSSSRRSYDPSPSNHAEPIFEGYQLIGDSQFVRFGEQLLNRTRRYKDKFAHIGMCVSGQKADDLLRRIRENFHPIERKVVLMIGTNDLIRNTPADALCSTLDSILDELYSKNVDEIILLTIPPVPRMAKSYNHWNTLHTYNDHIRTLGSNSDSTCDERPDVKIVDACIRYVDHHKDYYPEDAPSSEKYDSCNDSIDSNGYETALSSVDRRSSSLSKRRPHLVTKEERISKGLPESSPIDKFNLRITVGAKRKVNVISESSDYGEGSSAIFKTPISKRRRQQQPENDLLDGCSDPERDNDLSAPLLRFSIEITNFRTIQWGNVGSDDIPSLLDGSDPIHLRLANDDHNDPFDDESSFTSSQSPSPSSSYSSSPGTYMVRTKVPFLKINMDLFEEYFGYDNSPIEMRRRDGIHLNRTGLLIIRDLISQCIREKCKKERYSY